MLKGTMSENTLIKSLAELCVTVFCLYFIIITGTLHEDQYQFMIISRSVLLIKRNVSDKRCRGIKTHILFSVTFFFKSYVYIMWKHTVDPDRPQTTVWRMRIACWMTKAADTYLEYVIFVAFLLHQWLHDYASMLRHSYTARPHYSCHILKKLENFDRF